MAKKKGGVIKKEFGKALKDYGKWGAATNLDRFVTLVFMTAADKETFCKQNFGYPDVDYLDGAEVEEMKISPSAQKDLDEGG